jgi:hypothetical protein
MMKTSDVIAALSKSISEKGDLYVSHFKITDEIETSESFVYSPSRRDKRGNRLKITSKEFKIFVEELKAKKCRK